VNPGLQQVAKRGMDQAVTGQPSLAGKSGRDDQQAIVPAAAFGTCVARRAGPSRRSVPGESAQHREPLRMIVSTLQRLPACFQSRRQHFLERLDGPSRRRRRRHRDRHRPSFWRLRAKRTRQRSGCPKSRRPGIGGIDGRKRTGQQQAAFVLQRLETLDMRRPGGEALASESGRSSPTMA
jgi:hypothetical protein